MLFSACRLETNDVTISSLFHNYLFVFVMIDSIETIFFSFLVVRYQIDRVIWTIFAKRIDVNLKLLMFRYFKFNDDQFRDLIHDVIDFVVSNENRYYEKNLIKCLFNISIWQNKTLNIMMMNCHFSILICCIRSLNVANLNAKRIRQWCRRTL